MGFVGAGLSRLSPPATRQDSRFYLLPWWLGGVVIPSSFTLCAIQYRDAASSTSRHLEVGLILIIDGLELLFGVRGAAETFALLDQLDVVQAETHALI